MPTVLALHFCQLLRLLNARMLDGAVHVPSSAWLAPARADPHGQKPIYTMVYVHQVLGTLLHTGISIITEREK